MAESTLNVTPEQRYNETSPRNVMVVQLPRTVLRDDIGVKKETLLGMHTDTIGSMCNQLWRLKETTQENLYIEGRVLSYDQEYKLFSDPMFKFFWSGRAQRIEEKNQRAVLKLILPQDLDVSDNDLRKYAHMNFSPSSLADKLGYKTGWFQSSLLLSSASMESKLQNSLMYMLGGCNQFRIGSDTLSPAMLQLVRQRFVKGFENHTSDIIKSKATISDNILNLTARVFNIDV